MQLPHPRCRLPACVIRWCWPMPHGPTRGSKRSTACAGHTGDTGDWEAASASVRPLQPDVRSVLGQMVCPASLLEAAVRMHCDGAVYMAETGFHMHTPTTPSRGPGDACMQGVFGAPSASEHSGSEQGGHQQVHLNGHAGGEGFTPDHSLGHARDALSISSATGESPPSACRDVSQALFFLVTHCTCVLHTIGTGVTTPAAVSNGMDISPASEASDMSVAHAVSISNPFTEAVPWASQSAAHTHGAGQKPALATDADDEDDSENILAMLLR